MKMVKLALDDLQVESFAVEPAAVESRGTVQGRIDMSDGRNSECLTHCPTSCEPTCSCPSYAETHCDGDTCGDGDTARDWWCGGGTEA